MSYLHKIESQKADLAFLADIERVLSNFNIGVSHRTDFNSGNIILELTHKDKRSDKCTAVSVDLREVRSRNYWKLWLLELVVSGAYGTEVEL